ncbi:MAG: TetR-like C-terminal domain-containing protein [Bacillota bacterium]
MNCVKKIYLTNLLQESIKKQLCQDIITFSNVELSSKIPLEILSEFYAGTIAVLRLWWEKNGKKKTPEEMDHYFRLLCNQQHFN